MNVFGVEIPRAMVLLVYVYILTATAIAFWIGRPLIGLSFLKERLTANFRYALVRLRDSAENVAFYRGEEVERQACSDDSPPSSRTRADRVPDTEVQRIQSGRQPGRRRSSRS